MVNKLCKDSLDILIIKLSKKNKIPIPNVKFIIEPRIIFHPLLSMPH